ncbi:hypothetical protein [Hydromonas duriensis]|uniref:DUF721 domain-containing protein n=1 Tax=Hydromonas duriensis TaxID=1527608 RepID=A0A4R6Y7H2_9BURK|nr:hypothetical protein [Hydromonas duriensis]TDR31279.1 hypothetical protein DFR44_11142 [Hydromonas duriensis]
MVTYSKSKYRPPGVWRVNDTWLQTSHLAHTLPRLEQNAHLSIAIKALMPDTLKTGWRAFLSEHILTLKVPHNALATKIKQIAPLIVDGLNMTGWSIHHMEVKVSHFNRPVWLISPKKEEVEKNPRILTVKSAHRIADTISHLPDDSPVKAALIRMLAIHGEKKSN